MKAKGHKSFNRRFQAAEPGRNGSLPHSTEPLKTQMPFSACAADVHVGAVQHADGNMERWYQDEEGLNAGDGWDVWKRIQS